MLFRRKRCCHGAARFKQRLRSKSISNRVRDDRLLEAHTCILINICQKSYFRGPDYFAKIQYDNRTVLRILRYYFHKMSKKNVKCFKLRERLMKQDNYATTTVFLYLFFFFTVLYFECGSVGAGTNMQRYKSLGILIT